MTNNELIMLQALPLEIKIAKTELRIKEWVDHWVLDKVYLSFSGGKDSTVLAHIFRMLYKIWNDQNRLLRVFVWVSFRRTKHWNK